MALMRIQHLACSEIRIPNSNNSNNNSDHPISSSSKTVYLIQHVIPNVMIAAWATLQQFQEAGIVRATWCTRVMMQLPVFLHQTTHPRIPTTWVAEALWKDHPLELWLILLAFLPSLLFPLLVLHETTWDNHHHYVLRTTVTTTITVTTTVAVELTDVSQDTLLMRRIEMVSEWFHWLQMSASIITTIIINNITIHPTATSSSINFVNLETGVVWLKLLRFVMPALNCKKTSVRGGDQMYLYPSDRKQMDSFRSPILFLRFYFSRLLETWVTTTTRQPSPCFVSWGMYCCNSSFLPSLCNREGKGDFWEEERQAIFLFWCNTPSPPSLTFWSTPGKKRRIEKLKKTMRMNVCKSVNHKNYYTAGDHDDDDDDEKVGEWPVAILRREDQTITHPTHFLSRNSFSIRNNLRSSLIIFSSVEVEVSPPPSLIKKSQQHLFLIHRTPPITTVRHSFQEKKNVCILKRRAASSSSHSILLYNLLWKSLTITALQEEGKDCVSTTERIQ